MNNKVFISRLVSWVLLCVIAPVSFIMWRYELFSKVTKVQIGGWGLIAIIIIGAFVIVMSKYVKRIMGIKWSMLTQCLSGLFKVLVPLLTVYLVVYCIKDSIDNFLQALLITIVCETIAIPVNPFPEYIYKLSEGKTTDLINYVFDKREENK